LFIQFEEM